MAKNRLPPSTRGGDELRGRTVKSVTVGSWCPTPDSSGPALAVALAIKLETNEDLVFRMKTPRAVDEIIQLLLRHKRDVWPDAP